MALPLLPLGVAGLFGGIATLGAMTKGFTSEYEENFDYDYYDSDNPRFYKSNLVSQLNPKGFDHELFNQAMVEYHKLRPMY
jgi:hypothetical protein